MANYTLIGIPGAGKTYFGTHKIVEQLKRRYYNKKGWRYALSNYPVKHPKYGEAIRFIPELIYLPIQNCYNCIDEGYQYFGQNKKKSYNLDYEVFFGTVRHNRVDNLIIAHGMTRINADIRNKTEVFYVVRRIGLPRKIMPKPFWFHVDGYTDFENIDRIDRPPFETMNILFRKSVAQCYDTHFFKKPFFDMDMLPTWNENSLLEKPDMSNILNWINYKQENNEELSKSELNDILKNDGYFSEKKMEKIVKNGEITDWNNNILDEKILTDN